VYNNFGKAPGSSINMDKTEILPLGGFETRTISQPYRKYIVEETNILGILWSRDGGCAKK
jgi:hypothetical protein